MKKFKPILFSTAMVQAILEGRKTQTRRVIKPQPDAWVSTIPYKLTDKKPHKNKSIWVEDDGSKYEPVESRYKKGDILWVRETWFPTRYDYIDMLKRGITHFIKYKADGNYDPKIDCVGRSWKPSIHMPKLVCRIFLEVTDVRVERLQDISEKDAKAEGIQFYFEEMFQENRYRDYDKKLQAGYGDHAVDYPTWRDPISSFKSLWQSINGEESWDANPWVWVYEFKQVEKPENFLR